MRTKKFDEAMQETCASTRDGFWLLDLILIHALIMPLHWKPKGYLADGEYMTGDRQQAQIRLFMKKTEKDQSRYIEPDTQVSFLILLTHEAS